uniref:Uncharacterized protein n=1 Tax=Panagrolaimus davidi TaxID=227884 RepID=A0A914QVK2_9BILA
MLFCCIKIIVVFKSIELLIDIAIEGLAEHGAKFGDNETVAELSAEGERYVQTSSTPEYFSLKERKKLSFPITDIEQAYNIDPDGFKSINALNTESGMEEESTQDSKTRQYEKHRKKKSGKKKRSKKRH